jgi:hypothetical protein
MDGVVSPVLHTNAPAALVDIVDVPQLLATVTTGVAGSARGEAVTETALLVQPFMAWVTV